MNSLPDPDEDDTVDLPVPAFRTPAERQAVFDKLPRLLAAIRSAAADLGRVADAEDEDLDAIDRACDEERRARDALTAWFESWSDRPAAVIVADGTLIVYAVEADGLAIIPATDVHMQVV